MKEELRVVGPRPESGDDRSRIGGRRPYVAPEIETLGDIRDLTLGATPGIGDSSPANTEPG